MRAKDVMTREVVSAPPATPVSAIASLLLQHRISAVPIVEDGRLLGIVSEGDIMRRTEQGTEPEPQASWWLKLFSDPDALARDYRKRFGLTAADVMTRDVLVVGEDTHLAEIAKLLEQKRIKRVPVVRNGELVGIVSRSNLLHGLVIYHASQGVRVSDAEIRDGLFKKISSEAWSSPSSLNIVVADGVVHLWGFVRSEDERNALRVATETFPGVTKVENHVFVWPTRAAV